MHVAPEKSSKNMTYRNGFQHVYNLNKEWRLVLPSTFITEGKNFLEIAIAEAHVATVHCIIKKTRKALTDKFECLYFSCLARHYVRGRAICDGTKY